MNLISVAAVSFFVVLVTAVVVWSPLARGLVREAVRRPNEPRTFTPTQGGGVEVHRNVMPEELSSQPVVGTSSHFTWVLGATFVLTLPALVAIVVLLFAPDGERAASASGACETAFVFGFSALIGLIGGKAIK